MYCSYEQGIVKTKNCKWEMKAGMVLRLTKAINYVSQKLLSGLLIYDNFLREDNFDHERRAALCFDPWNFRSLKSPLNCQVLKVWFQANNASVKSLASDSINDVTYRRSLVIGVTLPEISPFLSSATTKWNEERYEI